MSNRRSIKVQRDGEEYEISAYAPGNGSLSFVARSKVDNFESAQSIYYLEENIRKYRDTYFPEHLVVNERIKAEGVDRWALCANVERVDKNHLKLNDRIYEIGEKVGNQIAPYNFYINHPQMGRNEVSGGGTSSVLNYYLNNEEAIELSKAQYGNGQVIERQKAAENEKEAEGPSM